MPDDRKITSNTLIPLGGILAFAVMFASFAYQVHGWMVKDAVWKASVDVRLADFENKIVGRGPNGWHRRDMEQYIRDFRNANKGKNIEIPSPQPYVP